MPARENIETFPAIPIGNGLLRIEYQLALNVRFGVHKETFQMSDAHHGDLAEANGNQVPFFVVSPMKFGVMTFFTLGFYWVYCFYQSWSLHREKTGERVSPFWRSAFAVFFIYPLLRRVNDHIRDSGKTYPWSILGLTLGYYGFCVVWVAASVVLEGQLWPAYFAGLAIQAAWLIILVFMQKGINFSAGDKEGKANSRFTLANWLWMLLGIALMAAQLFALIALSPMV
ncbi:hypothetical protein A210_24675 [Pseudomonas putida SJTE-1]|nr:MULTISPECIES: hypothetical protein [Pseudomonas]ANI05711.1 hypothetical protein A210_24675 [Pseudomonas putida SJTE-1]POA88298.1 hypothetical protein C1882_04650 [Pseudomonas sp. FW305-E2]QOJ92992.1 hypothetical protein ICN73_08995 [Pseudomonas taiwanensis]WQQ36582.1 hypothetical protein SO572_23740 [Pseudomonas putida]